MSKGAQSLSSTARSSTVTTVTNSLTTAHSSPGQVLLADPFPLLSLTRAELPETVARPPQVLPPTPASHTQQYQQEVNVYEIPYQTVQGNATRLVGEVTTKPCTLSSPSPNHSTDLIRQLLLRNLRAQKLLQLKLGQQQQQTADQQITHPQQIAEQQTLSTRQQDSVEHSPPWQQNSVGHSAPRQQIAQQEVLSHQQVAKTQQQENIRKRLLLLQQTFRLQQQQKTLLQQEQKLTRRFTDTSPQVGPSQHLSTSQFRKSSLLVVAEQAYQAERSTGREVLPHMTAGNIGAKGRPKGRAAMMDSRFSTSVDRPPFVNTSVDLPPFVNTCGDLPLSTDFIDASIYASSPSSLHLYEQEKLDMQCSMGVNTTCTNVETASAADDFDLKAQYEVSQDISSFPLSEIPSASSQTMVSSMIQDISNPSIWNETLKPVRDVYMKTESADVSAPTLAELNMNVDLLDDIESYINFEMNSNIGSSAPVPETNVKLEPGHISEKERSFVKLGQAGGSRVHVLMSPATYVQYVPIPASSSVVKIEPVELLAPCINEDHQKSFTPMMAVKPELKVPQVVTEMKQPLTTIKEIDISDFATLQRLLKTQPLQARVTRKRTVSEPQTIVKPMSRKRSVGDAGLESMEMKWEEIKSFLETQNATEASSNSAVTAPVRRERTRYDSTSSVMTLTSNEDDDSDSDKDYDDDSDSDMEGSHDIGTLNPSESLIGTKEKQYFWQYNVQSKGPKGTRVKFELEEDPHVLNDFEDPVFGPTHTGNITGIGVSVKHGGKARKGDGNDIVPSPKKLCQIGLQLRKINKQINDFVPVSELPSQARSKTRKEKNKLASRACRLKKKAQHEANKIKLHGLELEHRRLLTVIHLIRQKLYERLKTTSTSESMSETLEALIKEHLGEMIGGHTTDFVNSVIHKVEAGDISGGICIRTTRSYPKELHN